MPDRKPLLPETFYKGVVEKGRLAAGLALLVLVMFLAAAATRARVAPASDSALLAQVMALVGRDYVSPVNDDSLYAKAARGLVEQLRDPYSVLYTPKEIATFDASSSGHYAGVGMEVGFVDSSVVVQQIFPGTPAFRAGISEGDEIVSVDSVPARQLKADGVSGRLKGKPGTSVQMVLARVGVAAPIRVSLVRSFIHVPAVPYALMLKDDIGYIPLLQFSDSASDEVRSATRRLMKQGARGIILDLRGNPGGVLEEAMAVSNLYLKKGLEISSVRGRGETETYMATEAPLAPDIPLVVLCDGGSASASEIVLGALQDHDRALVLGTTSFGKGLVQSVFQLKGGWALKLTTAKWYTPSGRSIQKERKLLANGDFVEVRPDSLETDSARALRPRFRSDAGRIVYGGGAITPDLTVRTDTLNTKEQALMRVLLHNGPVVQSVLEQFAVGHRTDVTPGFRVPASWSREILTRLRARGMHVDERVFDAGSSEIDRLLDDDVTRVAFGDSAQRRLDLGSDPQASRALELLSRARTESDLFSAVGRIDSRKRAGAAHSGAVRRGA